MISKTIRFRGTQHFQTNPGKLSFFWGGGGGQCLEAHILSMPGASGWECCHGLSPDLHRAAEGQAL